LALLAACPPGLERYNLDAQDPVRPGQASLEVAMAEVKQILADAEHRMHQSVDALRREFVHLRAGRANPGLVEHIKVEAYGSEMPLNQISNITAPDATTIVIAPYDKSQCSAVERAILKSDLGLQPNSDGSVIRISIPPLTEDRRKDLLKVVGKVGEESKVALRNIRRDANEAIKKLEKAKTISEDELHHHLEAIDKMIEQLLKELEKVISDKEKEITEF
jgi:ribosome recycling factor